MQILLCFVGCFLQTPPTQSEETIQNRSCLFAVLKDVKSNIASWIGLARIDMIRKGVTREQIREILGEPTFERTCAGQCCYIYEDCCLKFRFEKDCPKKELVLQRNGKREIHLEWLSNPSLPEYKYRLVDVRLLVGK